MIRFSALLRTSFFADLTFFSLFLYQWSIDTVLGVWFGAGLLGVVTLVTVDVKVEHVVDVEQHHGKVHHIWVYLIICA